MDKLSADVAKARAAGMSYGMWKASQYKPVIVKKEEPQEKRKKIFCQQCGKEIVEYKYADKVRYCSRRCREVSYYQSHYIPKRKEK